jgi:MFS family permease
LSATATSPDVKPADAAEKLSGQTRLALAGLVIVAFSIGLDYVGVGILLVPIERSFELSDSTAQWVMNIYALTFAMLIVPGGRLCDMFGRKKMLIIGIVLFMAAAILNATAVELWWLLGSRVLQGMGAALMWPACMGIFAVSVPARRLGVFIGLLLTGCGLGNIVGPLVGGAFSGIAPWGWRLFFVFNAVTALIGLLIALFTVPRTPDESKIKAKIDYLGFAALSIGVFGILYAFDIVITMSWSSPAVITSLVVSVVAFTVFPFIERRVTDPLVNPAFWHNRLFVVSVAMNGLVVVAPFIMFVYVPVYTQVVYGYSFALSGLALLPLMIFMAGLSPLAGIIYDRLGPRLVMLAAYTSALSGSVLVALSAAGWGYWASIAPGLVLIGIAYGVAVGPAGTMALAAVDPKDASLAGGLGFAFHLALGAIAISIGTLILSTTLMHVVETDLDKVQVTVSESELRDLTGAAAGTVRRDDALAEIPASDRPVVQGAILSGTDQGFRSMFWVSGGFALVGLFLVLLLPRGKIETDGVAACP